VRKECCRWWLLLLPKKENKKREKSPTTKKKKYEEKKEKKLLKKLVPRLLLPTSLSPGCYLSLCLYRKLSDDLSVWEKSDVRIVCISSVDLLNSYRKMERVRNPPLAPNCRLSLSIVSNSDRIFQVVKRFKKKKGKCELICGCECSLIQFPSR
jgi:hypothetical protein